MKQVRASESLRGLPSSRCAKFYTVQSFAVHTYNELAKNPGKSLDIDWAKYELPRDRRDGTGVLGGRGGERPRVFGLKRYVVGSRETLLV